MIIGEDALYRVFIHNPPSEPTAGGTAKKRIGGQRSGFAEWRTNDLDRAAAKAKRVARGDDPTNPVKPDGWVTVQRRGEDGEYRDVMVYRKAVTA